jgi:outer membrane protein OmpA-like peptidoglycan-associated protein
MFGARVIVKRNDRDEAEKPFWISFADLMTALMVLFLVVMGVALLAVTKSVTERQEKEQQRNKNIELILEKFEQVAKRHDGVKIDKIRHVIDFGQRAQFSFGDWRLNAQQEEVLRKFVPEVIVIANDDLGKNILKRIVVEGYTDKKGSYLSNLNLSLQRSQSVLCVLFSTNGPSLLNADQKESVRSLFFVGGYSFNASKDTDEESRRVEMRLEFLGIDQTRPNPSDAVGNFGECALR